MHLNMGFHVRKPVFGADAQSDQHLCFSRIRKNHIETCYNVNFELVSVDEETGLSFALLETQKTCFLMSWPIYAAYVKCIHS